MDNALKKLKHLKSYSLVCICSYKQPILEELKKNNVQLEHYGFFIDEDEEIEKTFTSIGTAQPVSTISSLALEYPREMDPLRIKQSLTGLCLNLKCLTDLKVSCNTRAILQLYS